MQRCRPAGRFLPPGSWVIGLLGLLLLAALAPAPSAHADPGGGKPTVVLVHGAWADPSGWSGVAERLQNEGYPVVTTPGPTRPPAAGYLVAHAGGG